LTECYTEFVKAFEKLKHGYLTLKFELPFIIDSDALDMD